LLSAKTILRDLTVDTWIRGCPTEQSKEEEWNDENKYGQTPPKHDALPFQMRNDTLGSKSSPKSNSKGQDIPESMGRNSARCNAGTHSSGKADGR
jgi:hypothetical protein